MSNPVLVMSGIGVMLGGFIINFLWLASNKILDLWLGFGLLSIPIILGGVILLAGVWYKDEEKVMPSSSRSPIT